MRIIYLFIRKIILKCSNKKKQEIHQSTLNANWAHRKAILFFTEFALALTATVESLVMDVSYAVLIRFPIITGRSKGATTFIELLVYYYTSVERSISSSTNNM